MPKDFILEPRVLRGAFLYQSIPLQQQPSLTNIMNLDLSHKVFPSLFF